MLVSQSDYFNEEIMIAIMYFRSPDSNGEKLPQCTPNMASHEQYTRSMRSGTAIREKCAVRV